MFETVCLDKNIENVDCTTLDEQLDFILRQKSESESTLEVTNGAPILVGRIRTREGQESKVKTIRILLDSGASATLIDGNLIKDLPREKTAKAVRWQTRGGRFNTTAQCKIKFTLPEFSDQKLVEWSAYVDDATKDTSLNYDMIMGRDLPRALKLKIDFIDDVVTWHDMNVPMKNPEATIKSSY